MGNYSYKEYLATKDFTTTPSREEAYLLSQSVYDSSNETIMEYYFDKSGKIIEQFSTAASLDLECITPDSNEFVDFMNDSICVEEIENGYILTEFDDRKIPCKHFIRIRHPNGLICKETEYDGDNNFIKSEEWFYGDRGEIAAFRIYDESGNVYHEELFQYDSENKIQKRSISVYDNGEIKSEKTYTYQYLY